MKRFSVIVVLLLIGVLAVSAAPKFKIGMVFDLAGRGDNSFNDSAYRGLVALAKAYKGWIQDDPSKVNFGSDAAEAPDASTPRIANAMITTTHCFILILLFVRIDCCSDVGCPVHTKKPSGRNGSHGAGR